MTAVEALSVPILLEEAAERAGSDDWGDRAFVDTLAFWLESCLQTAALHAAGREVLRKVVLRHLLNRLYVNAYCRSHPGVPAAPLPVAIVVTGMPRTGTTLLHNLLALDPDRRVLRLWEALHPLPADGRTMSDADLIGRASVWLDRTYQLTPALQTIHPATAQGPEECDALLQNGFASQHFDDMFDAESYSAWLGRADLTREYEYYALQLRVLQAADARPRPWVLKSPSHLGHLTELLAALPGVVVVQCHRQPDAAIASYASLVAAVRWPHTDRMTASTIGEQALQRTAVAAARALAVRATTDQTRFIDIGYARMVDDPLGTVREIYSALGRTVGEVFEGRMRAWLADNPRNRHGPHAYDLQRFGLDEQRVTDVLGPTVEPYQELLGA